MATVLGADMRMRTGLARAGVLLALGVTAGCGGGASAPPAGGALPAAPDTTASAAPQSATRCSVPQVPVALLAPAKGATGVDPSRGSISVAIPSGVAPAALRLQVTGNLATVLLGALGPDTTHAAPPGSSAMTALLPPLAPHTTYTVQAAFNEVSCLAPWSVGSFTTK